ncbi:hypothetical protein C0580_00075 [Candidatus Parcubacteria bacterium]|nr:MAG: hypothetical protein C0580_00075 [Candidatus Parcubacteria bacterium]
MGKYLVPLVSPLIFLIGFWIFFYSHSGLLWLISISIITVFVSGRILSGKRWWRFILLWLSLIFSYIAQLLFLLLLTSGTMRYGLSVLLGVFWAMVWWFLRRYFDRIDDAFSQEYLAFKRFFYYVSFWFLTSSLYSLVIFLSIPLYYLIIIILGAAWLWGREILYTADDKNSLYIYFGLFLLAQVITIVYFIPVSFYVMGTIATLWFFFIIDSTMRKINFPLYLGLFLLGSGLLIFSSLL